MLNMHKTAIRSGSVYDKEMVQEKLQTMEGFEEEHPDILIVDEILAVGDERFQRKSRARMLELMSGGATVLFVSHNLSQIRELCDRVIWLEHGRIRAQGDAKSLCDAYEREAAP